MAHTQTALTIQEWDATNLEFTLHKSNVVWAKPLLQRIVSEVPHATRNKVSDFIKAQGAYLKPTHSSASGKCETAFWGVFLWCVYCEGCMWCLEGEVCVARKFKDRDESRRVLQKWEEEVEVWNILHPTQSHAETTPSSPCALSPPPHTRPQMHLLPARL